jgi:S-adenosyl-L-methionine hydrolase (adenosine-forming)
MSFSSSNRQLAIGNRKSLITLLTDFGTQDYFVGAMKGVILSANPSAKIVDLTHEVPPQDIHAAAFNLLATYRDFPAGTIHVAVVDPGVGSSRRPILIECAGQLFVGPDNGLFSWICEREGSFVARHLTNEKYFRQPKSATFHGRDVFAPVAAALSNGVAADELGPLVADLIQLESLTPRRNHDGTVEAAIIHIDRFGNCITNLTLEHFTPTANRQTQMVVNGHEINSRREFFSDAAQSKEALFMISGSAGFIEIAAQNSSAAAILKARPGQPVRLQPSPRGA